MKDVGAGIADRSLMGTLPLYEGAEGFYLLCQLLLGMKYPADF